MAALVVNVLSARTMGPEGRGTLALLLQIAYVANLLCMAGIDRAYPATVVGAPSSYRATIDTWRLVVPSTCVTGILFAPAVFALAQPRGAGPATAGAFLLALVGLIATAALRTGGAASGAGRPYLAAIVVGQVLLVVMAAGFTTAGVATPDAWLMGYGACLAVGPGLVSLVMGIRNWPTGDDRRNLRVSRRLGLRLLPAAIANMITLRADRLVLPWLASVEQLGLYIVVATVTELIAWPVQSYVDAMTPRWHQRCLEGRLRPLPLFGAAIYGAAAASLVVGIVHVAVVPLFGSAYSPSIPLVGPLAIGAACYSVGRVAVGLGIAAGRARAALAADLPAMVISLVSYLLLIPPFGALGAAWGSALAYGLGSTIAVLACRRSPREMAAITADAPRKMASLDTPAGQWRSV